MNKVLFLFKKKKIIIIIIIIIIVVYRITFLWVVFLLMYLVSICAHIVGGSS